MGKKLAIKGHLTRGEEVIETLKMLGGNDDGSWWGCDMGSAYFINDCTQKIDVCTVKTDIVVFTLEEFLEKYPYKVGDKVVYEDDNDIVVISEIKWDNTVGDIFYNVKRIDEDDCFLCPPELLKPYKETNMNENKFPSFELMFKMNDKLNYKIPDGYEITEVSKDTVFIKPIKPQYPKTYKECCDVLLIPPYYNLRYHTYERGYNEYATSNTLLSLQDKLNILGKLIICRDAYWKIYGEEKGLGKPWKPDWLNETTKYGIQVYQNIIIKDNFIRTNCAFVFPTPEIRDTFYENFKDLIESCKELL